MISKSKPNKIERQIGTSHDCDRYVEKHVVTSDNPVKTNIEEKANGMMTLMIDDCMTFCLVQIFESFLFTGSYS